MTRDLPSNDARDERWAYSGAAMTLDEFKTQLRDEGFETTTTVVRERNGSLDDHQHSFEAKALILTGEIRLRVEAEERTYRVGDVFHLRAGQVHSEFYGPDGVTYFVGRKES